MLAQTQHHNNNHKKQQCSHQKRNTHAQELRRGKKKWEEIREEVDYECAQKDGYIYFLGNKKGETAQPRAIEEL